MNRVVIGRNRAKLPYYKMVLSVPIIYIPLFTTVPFMILNVLLVRAHLKYSGATNMRSYWDFVPEWISHRYQYNNQITYRIGNKPFQLQSYRWFWIFNCKLYCPMSVALFRYNTYLVQLVENWWCPFYHDKKRDYADAKIDLSYWHFLEKRKRLLHPEDRENDIWNDSVEKSE